MKYDKPEDLHTFYESLKNEYEFFKIIDSFSGGYFASDLEKREIHYSPKWKKRLGVQRLPPEEAEAATLSLIHPDDAAGVMKKYEDAFKKKSKKIMMDFRIKTVDSGYIWAHTKAKVQYSQEGKPERVFGVCIDITEAKRAAEALKFQTEILSSVRDAVISIDQKYNITYWNSEAEKLFGWTAGEASGRYAKDLLKIETPGLSAEKAASMMQSSGFNLGEIVCYHKDGHPVLVEVHARTMKNENGSFAGAISTISDIASRKKAEEKINRQTEIMRIINKVYEKSVSCATQQELGIECLRIIDSAAGSGLSIISGVKEDGNLRFIAVRVNGREKHGGSEMEHPGEAPYYSSILKDGKSLLINDPSSRPENSAIPQSHIKFDSFLGTPFVQKGKVLGLIGVANKEGGFKEEDRELLETVTPSILEVLQRKRTEEELKKSEEKYRELVESTPAGIFEYDIRSGKVTSVNNAVCKATGYSKEELLRMDPAALLDEKSAAVFHRRLSRLAGDSEPEKDVDYRVISKDGKEGYAQFSVKFIKDKNGLPVEISGTVNDVTERRKMEDALNKALIREQVLRELMSRLLETDDPDEIMKEICGKSACFIDCDLYFNHIFDENVLKLNVHSEMSEDRIKGMEILGCGEAVSGAVARDGNPIIACDIQHGSDEMTLKARHFGLRSLACFPLKAGGRVIGTLSFGSEKNDNFSEDDISFIETVCYHIAIALSRVLIAKELKESEEKALRLVEEIKKTDQDKDRFLSAISHELRNPLATISAGIQLLKACGDMGTADSTMEIINRQMSRLCRLADDLLELTRLTYDKMSIRKQRVDLSGLIQTAAEDHASFFGEKEVKVLLLAGTEKLYAEADPNRIGQAVGNLLHNAAKYSYKGGGVTISVYPEEKNAVISVSDSGIGIDEGFLPHIFEPFSQADTSLDRPGGGLGLGLSITKGIIENHGGSIAAKSGGLGKGSEFIIRLPLVPSRENDLNEDKQTKDEALPLKVLIIEDNADYAGVLSELLKKNGHDTFISYDGIDGAEKANELSPDIIICDIGLPGMSGYDVAEKIRRDGILKKTFMVALSGYAGAQFGENAKKAGFDRYITKPADTEALDMMIKGYAEKIKRENL